MGYRFPIGKSLLSFGIIFGLYSTTAEAETAEVIQEKETGGSSAAFDTSDGEKVEINNSEEEAGVRIGGEELAVKEHLRTSKATELTMNGSTLLLVEYRMPGTSSELIFEVYNLTNNKEQIYQSEGLNRGTVNVKDGDISYAEPGEGNNGAASNPDRVEVTSLEGDEQGLETADTRNVTIEEYQEAFGGPETGTNFASADNPRAKEINKLLTSKAEENDIPPEVLKAIAWQESGWRQFEEGEPLIGFDGIGIGIMQVSPGYTGLPEEEEDDFEERLKTDIEFNIDMGIKILLDKWEMSRLPTVNDGSKEVIDNWYFAVMAYNSISERNDPEEADAPYQDLVFSHMQGEFGALNIHDFPVDELEITYPHEDNPELMSFEEKQQYNLSYELTRSRHNYEEENIVSVRNESPVYDSVNGEIIDGLSVDEIANIESGLQFDSERTHHYGWYQVELQDGKEGYIRSGEITNERLAGELRYDSAVEVSREGWTTSDTVVLATGEDFPDALAGTPLAYQQDAPILLTKESELPEATEEEIERLGADNVIILGGSKAVDEDIEAQLQENGANVERIAGKTRYETSELIAERIENQDEFVLANGRTHADALAVAPYAARNQTPILLTREETVPEPTDEALQEAGEIKIVGGEAAVSASIADDYSNTERYSGSTRYETASTVINELGMSKENGFMVNGRDFPDALTASVLAAKVDASLILSKEESVPRATQELGGDNFTQFTVVGGHEAVSSFAALKFKNDK